MKELSMKTVSYLTLICSIILISGCNKSEIPVETQKNATLQLTSNVANSVAKLNYKANTIDTLIGSGTFSDIAPGIYSLSVEAPGFIGQTEVLSFFSGQILKKNIQLVRIPFTPMVHIPAGTFTMGCTGEQTGCSNDETPTHQVTLSAYEIGKYEVTQKEWWTVMTSFPSQFNGDSRPVEQVSWYDVITFCNTLSKREGLTPVYTVDGTTVTANWSANGYRLPTEAEWEYAARGGPHMTNTLYSGSNTIGSVAWYNIESNNSTQNGGLKGPNKLGIYDMSGNVWEWCWDRYGKYPSSSQTNPTGPTSGSVRISRGGSWFHYAEFCRVSYRGGASPYSKVNFTGFRVARTKN